MYMRHTGFCLKAWLVYSITICSTVGWILPWVYSKSASFYQPYMLSVGTIALFGWAASVFFFGEQITYLHYFAIVLLLSGAFLIVR
jgi:hypothetical protein